MKNQDHCGRCLPRLTIAVVLMLALLVLPAGCALLDLKKDMEAFELAYGLVGKIITAKPETGSLIVVLYAQQDNQIKIADYALPESTGHFSFMVSQGTYYLCAFEDLNNNFIRESDEAYGFLGAPDPIAVIPGETVSVDHKTIKKLDITLSARSGFPADFPVIVNIGELRGQSFLRAGQVVDLDDPLFDQANGSKGYWQPFAFLRDIGFGVYFAEPYDPGKIPILFVHGATGTPRGWQTIVQGLDSSRFQMWYCYYPSGFGLDAVADTLNATIRELHNKYPFKRLYVVAHSMGGLVSRGFIVKNAIEDRQPYIKLFVSLSTPWGGVATAAMGVKNAPVAVPSWYDVQPDSDYIKYIYNQSLPPHIRFYLFFGVKGKCSMMMANNDGTIEIASEIDYRAQWDAHRIFGFDADHVETTNDPIVLEKLYAVINGEYEKKQ